ncbi:MAG: hypothetical protein KDE63_10155 [Novosphingobium sp.]|nr:hypothetical protein [Novosphingobium sp.]
MKGIFRFRTGSTLAMALAAAVAVTGMGVGTAPAYAKKGGNSKEFVAAAGPFQKQIESLSKEQKDGADVTAKAKALIPEVEKVMAAASTPADQLIAGNFGQQLAGMAGDMALRARGVKMMLDSGELKPEQVPQFQFYLGNFAYASGDYATAGTALTAAAKGGITEEQLVPLLIESYGKGGNAAEGLSVARQQIEAAQAAGKVVPEAWLNRATVVAFNSKLAPQANAFSGMLVHSYPSNFNWLTATQIARSMGNLDPDATLDLFRLMDRSGALDNKPEYVKREYREYVETADPRRYPGEVVRVINEGMAAGALSSSDTWATEAKTNASGRISSDKASLAGSVKSAMAGSAKSAQALGDGFLNYGEAAQAEQLYAAALTKPGVDANLVQTRLGIAQFDQGKYSDAAASFAKVTGPRQPMAQLWQVLVQNKTKPAAAPAPAATQ